MDSNVNIDNYLGKYPLLGINSELMDSYCCLFENYGDFVNQETRLKSVHNFLLSNEHKTREKCAKDLIKNHWNVHSKKSFYRYLNKLSQIEPGIQVFKETHRDHVVHTAYTFLLGLHLFKLNKNLRRSIKRYFHENELESYSPMNLNGHEIFDGFFLENNGQKEPSDDLELLRFMWLLISTFHDLGYPFESFIYQMGTYITHINSLGKDQEEYINISPILPFNEMDKTSIGNSFELLNNIQKNYNIDGNYLDLEKYLEDRLKEGFVDHGIISALLLLKTSDALYMKNPQWNKDFFVKTFPHIALSIALHNVDWDFAKKNYDKLPEITLEDFPLCYLLIVADTLQEWDRPAKSSSYELIKPTNMSIKLDQTRNKFIVGIDSSDEKIMKLNEEFQTKLSSKDVPIIEKRS